MIFEKINNYLLFVLYNLNRIHINVYSFYKLLCPKSLFIESNEDGKDIIIFDILTDLSFTPLNSLLNALRMLNKKIIEY